MIKWSIISMESQPSTGIVVSANWICNGSQNEFVASISGTSVFPEPASNYVPYADLTENQVLGWVWSDGGVNQVVTEESVNNAIQIQINPVVIQHPLPWTIS
jgi:hypothetical protein